MKDLDGNMKATKVGLDIGSICHFLLGLLSTIFGGLGYTILLSALFILKQILDLMNGEAYEETSGDIAEFCSGVIVGLVLLKILLFYAPFQ